MNRTLAAGLAAAAIVAVAVPVMAQNFNRNPAFGTYRLSAGFQPDPYTVRVRAGGTRNAANISPSCAGSIADAPDVRVIYNGGQFPLSFIVRAGVDTTLVVNDPNGTWYCDDDSAGNLDPQVRFNRPVSGQYDVWIGVYGGGRGIPAQLQVTEY